MIDMRYMATFDAHGARQQGTVSLATTKLFLRAIQSHFILGLSDASSAELRTHVAQLSSLELKAIWRDILRQNMLRSSLPEKVGCTASAPNPICIDSGTSSLKLQLSDSNCVCGSCQVEKISWTQLDSWIDSAGLRQLSNNVAPGADVRSMFTERILPVASVADYCVVFDRFAGSRLLRRSGNSGLVKFCNYLVGSGIRRLVVVTGYKAALEISAMELSVANLSANVDFDVRLVTAHDSRFSKSGHDRFVVFQSGNCATTFDIGKEIGRAHV